MAHVKESARLLASTAASELRQAQDAAFNCLLRQNLRPLRANDSHSRDCGAEQTADHITSGRGGDKWDNSPEAR